MRTIETTGKTPEEAIEVALDQLGGDREEVSIDVVNQGKGISRSCRAARPVYRSCIGGTGLYERRGVGGIEGETTSC